MTRDGWIDVMAFSLFTVALIAGGWALMRAARRSREGVMRAAADEIPALRIPPNAAELRALSRIITVRTSPWAAGWKLLVVAITIGVIAVVDKKGPDLIGLILVSILAALFAAIFLFALLTGRPRLIISRVGVELEPIVLSKSTFIEWSEVDGNFVDVGNVSEYGPASLVSFNLVPGHPGKRKKLLSDTYDVALGGDYSMANRDIVKLLNERLHLWRASRPA